MPRFHHFCRPFPLLTSRLHVKIDFLPADDPELLSPYGVPIDIDRKLAILGVFTRFGGSHLFSATDILPHTCIELTAKAGLLTSR